MDLTLLRNAQIFADLDDEELAEIKSVLAEMNLTLNMDISGYDLEEAQVDESEQT